MKKWNIIIFLVLIIIISVTILTKPISNLDEIWNFNFAKNIAEGKLPYKDFNMIQLPLLHMVAAIFLCVFGTEILVMRFLGILLCSAILFVTYKIFERLKVNKFFAFMVVLGIYCLFYEHFCFDYNYGTLLITLLIIYFELTRLKKEEKIISSNFKSDIVLGILAGCSILFKSTTGIFLSLIFIFYKLLLAKDKEDFKTVLKIVGARILGVAIPVMLFAIYLTVNNIWADFINYSIKGISTFKNYVPYTRLLKDENIGIKILSIISPLVIVFMYFKTVALKMKKIEDKNLFIIFVYSVASFIIAFPISDTIHFLIGALISIIGLTYILWQVLQKLGLKYKKLSRYLGEFVKVFSILGTTALIIYSIYGLCSYIKIGKEHTDLEHFKYIEASEAMHEMKDFVIQKKAEGKNVYILDASAAAYRLPAREYVKDYDMFLVGNLGEKGEEGQIEKIKQEDENTLILIMNDNHRRNWQNPELVREYIIENWNKTGEVIYFDIYEKGK